MGINVFMAAQDRFAFGFDSGRSVGRR